MAALFLGTCLYVLLPELKNCLKAIKKRKTIFPSSIGRPPSQKSNRRPFMSAGGIENREKLTIGKREIQTIAAAFPLQMGGPIILLTTAPIRNANSFIYF